MKHANSLAHYGAKVCAKMDGHHGFVCEIKSMIRTIKIVGFRVQESSPSHSMPSMLLTALLPPSQAITCCERITYCFPVALSSTLVNTSSLFLGTVSLGGCRSDREWRMFAPEHLRRMRRLSVSVHWGPSQAHQPRIVRNQAVVYCVSSKHTMSATFLSVIVNLKRIPPGSLLTQQDPYAHRAVHQSVLRSNL